MPTRSFSIVLTIAALAACASPAVEAPAAAAPDTPLAEAGPATAPCPWCGQAIPPGKDPVVIFSPGGCIREPVIWSPRLLDEPSGLPTLDPLPEALPEDEALEKARVDGAYRGAPLRRLAVPGDHAYYGAYHDWGRWEGTAYAGHIDLPPGDWVYVYPHWYIWESVAR